MVNYILRSYQRPTVEEFTVRFDVDNADKDDIDKWVKFAMEKRVKRFELDLTNTCGFVTMERCTFDNLHSCDSLTSLKLSAVNVTGDVIENCFKTCPQLEFVQIILSKTLVNLKVASVKLSLLEVNKCYTEYMEIFAPNLVSFKYWGLKISMRIRSTTKLTELVVAVAYAYHLVRNFSEFSSHLSQLEMLTLNLSPVFLYDIKYVVAFSEWKMIKRLEVIASPSPDENLFGLTSIIKACLFMSFVPKVIFYLWTVFINQNS